MCCIKRVAIYLNKAIDKVDAAFCLLYPFYAVVIKNLCIARVVILYQEVDNLLLLLILCVFPGLEKVFNDFLNCLAVFSSNVPYIFRYLAINLTQGRVERMLMAEILNLFLCQPS